MDSPIPEIDQSKADIYMWLIFTISDYDLQGKNLTLAQYPKSPNFVPGSLNFSGSISGSNWNIEHFS